MFNSMLTNLINANKFCLHCVINHKTIYTVETKTKGSFMITDICKYSLTKNI